MVIAGKPCWIYVGCWMLAENKNVTGAWKRNFYEIAFKGPDVRRDGQKCSEVYEKVKKSMVTEGKFYLYSSC